MTSDKACQMPIEQLVEELWAEIPTGTYNPTFEDFQAVCFLNVF